jgi:hypothetical protein
MSPPKKKTKRTSIFDRNPNGTARNACQAARDYIARDWKPVPIEGKQKRTTIPDWQNRKFEAEDFGIWGNIGIQFGPCSNGLCDVDLDCDEARAVAPFLLPESGAVFGRRSAAESHWLYVSDAWRCANRAAEKLEDPIRVRNGDLDSSVLVEFRTGREEKGVLKGVLSMFPPSVHPSGERVRWAQNGEPAEVDAAVLRQSVRMVAAATLLVRYYPAKGRQHDAALVLGGFLARAGWNERKIGQFVEAIAKSAKDGEWRGRVTDAKSAVQRFKENKSVPGIPRMREIYDGAVVDAVIEWLEVERDNQQPPQRATKVEKDVKPRTVDQVLKVFKRWLVLEDSTPIYAMLGTIAANRLPGDPVWLGLIAPPSSAKTELLNATSQLPFVVSAATLTQGALLSGVPKKQFDRRATGGLLRQIGEFGVLVLKDFGSILSMRPDAKNEILAALREIYDGAWTRLLGTDGGKALTWEGKMGMLFGATGVIDQHYGVIGAMGDRFLLCRLTPSTNGQFERALKHSGAATKTMRNELSDAVAGLFACDLPEPRKLSDDEMRRLDRIVTLVVRLRGAVHRDRFTREIEIVLGAEGTARLGLTLERLLAGLDTLGVEREVAFDVVKSIAMDSVPPLRREAYEFLRFDCPKCTATTLEVAKALHLSTTAARRTLEDLAAYGVVRRLPKSDTGKRSDQWITGKWGQPPENEDQ